MSRLQYGNPSAVETKSDVLQHIRLISASYSQIQDSLRNGSYRSMGDPLKEGRKDLLFDFCLYFLGPHSLLPLDVDFMVKLSQVWPGKNSAQPEIAARHIALAV